MKELLPLIALILLFGCAPESTEKNPSINLNELKKWADVVIPINDFTREDYTANYDQHETEFRALESYFLSIIPDSTEVEIEFKTKSAIEILAIRKTPDVHERAWHLKLGSQQSDSLFALIGWKQSTLDTLYTMLQEINCISISNFGQTLIGYKRSGLSKFSYKIFDHNLSREEIEQYNSCNYMFYRDNIVLEYGSGAIGSLCFPERYREIEM